MEELLTQASPAPSEKNASVVLDVENLSESINGSPKWNKVLSRKASSRMERRTCEDMESDDLSRKLLIDVLCPELEHSRPPPVTIKCLTTVPASINFSSSDADGRNKKFGSVTSIRPRKILLFFASLSCLGTLILIYFTLAINHRGGI